jgi:hypothetical protein
MRMTCWATNEIGECRSAEPFIQGQCRDLTGRSAVRLWHTRAFYFDAENAMSDKDQSAGSLEPADAIERNQRLAKEIAIAGLLMKIHGAALTPDEARAELAEILAGWTKATEQDIREAHEDVESTIAHGQTKH